MPTTHTTHTIKIPYHLAANMDQGNANSDDSLTPSKEDMTQTSHTTPLKLSPSPSLQELAEGLEGKYVDEFGNVLDWDGTVLGRVEGDLPTMVGRPVSKMGDILDSEGEIAGHVSENYTKSAPLKELEGGLRVDEAGNIYDQSGSQIGKLNEPPKKPLSGQDSKPCSCSAQKPSQAPNPSEIYLDVKSTHEGIQLVIKIPTVFNKGREKLGEVQTCNDD